MMPTFRNVLEYVMDKVAHAYVVDGECEQIEWGTDVCLPDDPALIYLYTTPQRSEPEMLKALRLALEYWEDRQQRYKNRHPVWVQIAHDAINKAEGRE